MSSVPSQPPRHRNTVSPGKVGQTTQLVQGAYYVLAGLSVAAGIHLFESDHGPSSDQTTNLWVVRAIALLAAGAGVALFLSGARRGRSVVAGFGMWTALVLTLLTGAGLAFRVLPAMFLIDLVLEFGFFVWWAVTMLGRVDKLLDRTEPGAA